MHFCVQVWFLVGVFLIGSEHINHRLPNQSSHVPWEHWCCVLQLFIIVASNHYKHYQYPQPNFQWTLLPKPWAPAQSKWCVPRNPPPYSWVLCISSIIWTNQVLITATGEGCIQLTDTGVWNSYSDLCLRFHLDIPPRVWTLG
jgi:hypothetical protein